MKNVHENVTSFISFPFFFFFFFFFFRSHLAGNAYMVASTVSTKMLASMGKVEGFKVCHLTLNSFLYFLFILDFQFAETLTGFKWMGNKALELRAKGKN